MELWNWQDMLEGIIYLQKSDRRLKGYWDIEKKQFMKTKLFTIVLFICCSLSLFAQSQGGEREALKLAKEADKLRREGKFFEADKMLLSANDMYPIPLILDAAAKEKLKLGDIKTANVFWNAAIARLKQSEKNDSRIELIYLHQINDNFSSGDSMFAILLAKDYLKWMDANDSKTAKAYFEGIVYNAVEHSFYIEDAESIKIFYDAAVKYKSNAGMFIGKSFLLLIEKKYDEAILFLNDKAENGAGFMMSKTVAKFLIPLAYSLKGDYQNMSLSIDRVPNGILVDEKALNQFYGLKALANKEYTQAIVFFTEAIKPVRFLFVLVEKPGKYRFYTGRAEAYIGLKDYVSARKDFESALLFNANYQPALDGLAKLESSQIVERRTDKAGPEIKILEPIANRGLEVVAAGKDIMIKGIASDQSGLKEVLLNGSKIYAKEDGNFWGSAVLKDGANTFEIIAVDLAGNSSAHTITIEKTSEAVPVAATAAVEKQGRNYAVFIASQNYDDVAIPSLENPIADAVKLKLILKNSYNFTEENIFTLFNPQRSDFKKKFLELREVLQPEDNLVIFYAGHGIWVEKEKKGYWLFTDAQRNDVNTWIPNREVLDMIAELPSRHTLLITDACFSGSVFKSRGIGEDAPAALKEMDAKITRVAITSGNDTEVPDESIFMKYLLKALSENKDKYMSAQKMFVSRIIEAVMTDSKTEPRYGTLELAGHVGGDYIFAKK